MENSSNFDLRKVLDELHSNRISIENDRKSFEKVRSEILAADDELNQLTTRWTALKKKEKEIGETVAVRTSDIGLLNIKIQILQRSCENLEERIHLKRNDVMNAKEALQCAISNNLEQTSAFCREWNCSEHGRKYREDLQSSRINDMTRFKCNLEYDLDDFLLLQRNIEQAELEKNEMEEEYKKLAIIQRGKESQLRSKVKETEMLLTSLIKKRKEYSEIPEMTSVGRKIEETRKSIVFWETRVAESQKALESQRNFYSKLNDHPNKCVKKTQSVDDPEAIKRSKQFSFKKLSS